MKLLLLIRRMLLPMLMMQVLNQFSFTFAVFNLIGHDKYYFIFFSILQKNISVIFSCVLETTRAEEEDQVTTEEAPSEEENRTEVVDLAPKEAAAAPNARGVFVPWPKKVTNLVNPLRQGFSN